MNKSFTNKGAECDMTTKQELQSGLWSGIMHRQIMDVQTLWITEIYGSCCVAKRYTKTHLIVNWQSLRTRHIQVYLQAMDPGAKRMTGHTSSIPPMRAHLLVVLSCTADAIYHCSLYSFKATWSRSSEYDATLTSDRNPLLGVDACAWPRHW